MRRPNNQQMSLMNTNMMSYAIRPVRRLFSWYLVLDYGSISSLPHYHVQSSRDSNRLFQHATVLQV